MKVIRKQVGFEPEMIDIGNTLEALRAEVGGHIELFGSHVCDGNFVVNEEGRLLDLPYNCTVEGRQLFGTIIYIGPLAGDFDDADPAAVKRYIAQATYGNLRPEAWVWA